MAGNITTTFTFNDETAVLGDKTLADFNPNDMSIKLLDKSGLNFNQPFSSAVGFTLNSVISEITAGLLQQKSQLPAGATALATYTVDEDFNYITAGSKVGQLTLATVSGGRVDLTTLGARIKYFDIRCDGNEVAIRVGYVPNYTGNPFGSINIFYLSESDTQLTRSQIELQHDAASAFRLTTKDSTGAVITTGQGFGTLPLTAGVRYDIELNIKYGPSPAQRLFVNGVQQGGTTTAGPAVTTGNRRYLSSGQNLSDHFLEDLVVFGAVAHTADFPGELPYSYAETEFVEDKVIAPDFLTPEPGRIQSVDTLTLTETGNIRGTLVLFAVEFFWNSSTLAYKVSNGSRAESSLLIDLFGNLDSLDNTGAATLGYRIFTESSNSQDTLDLIDIDYTSQEYNQTQPEIYPAAAFQASAISDITKVVDTSPSNTSVLHRVYIKNVPHWYNSGWLVSTDKTTENNDLATIVTNIATLPIVGGSFVSLSMIMTTTDGFNTPIVTSETLVYTFNSVFISPNINNLYAYTIDFGIDPQTPVTVRIFFKKPIANADNILINAVETVSDSFGYISLDVAQTEAVLDKFTGDTISVEASMQMSWTDIDGKAKKRLYKAEFIPDQSMTALTEVFEIN